jgi:hypothetical protein
VTSTAGIDLARLTDGDKASRPRAGASGRAGQIAEGLIMIEEANARSERTEECWPIAELLRVKDELLLLQGAPGAGPIGFSLHCWTTASGLGCGIEPRNP